MDYILFKSPTQIKSEKSKSMVNAYTVQTHNTKQSKSEKSNSMFDRLHIVQIPKAKHIRKE